MSNESGATIGLISAVAEEGLSFTADLRSIPRGGAPLPALYGGTISGRKTVYAISGMGKVNAAHAATVLILEYRPSLVINFGAGGAYPSSGLRIGNIAVALREIYADEGVLAGDGFHTLEATGIPLLRKNGRRYFNDFPLDGKLARSAEAAARSVAPAKAGVFVTVSACSGTEKRAGYLQGLFGAICENMEGAAVAHICRSYGVPCVEIRGISNIVEDRDRSKWDIRLASANSQSAVREFLKRRGKGKG